MELRNRSVALYGRFTAGAREALAGAIVRRGGRVARDLTRRSDFLVVGALAAPLIDAGHLGARLAAARARRVPVHGERGFAEAMLEAAEGPAPSLPVETIAAQAGLTRDDIDVLAAFDIVRIENQLCGFADGAQIKSAAELVAGGATLSQAVRILTRARDHSPKGRRRIVAGPKGEGALEWDTGLTTLEGQGYLPLDEHASIEDLFEAAAVAEAEGELAEAARLYDQCARVDKKDPIACFNLGNIRLAEGAHDEAVLAFSRALVRDAEFVEARYNLACAYEALGRQEAAREQLLAALDLEPDYADARFNLAQLELKRGAVSEAKAHYEAYLRSGPPDEWAAKARRAIQYCTAKLSA